MMLELQATAEEVMRGVEAVQEFGRQLGLGDKDIFSLALAVEECACNIVNHAYGRDPQKKFRLEAHLSDRSVTIELRDSGPVFDPTRHVPQIDPSDDRPPGGWGIALVSRNMDNISYQRRNGENILRLTKQVNPDKATGRVGQSNPTKKQTQNASNDMPLEIKILKDVEPSGAGPVTVKLKGSLDTLTAPDLERQLGPVLATPIKDLIYDLAELKFISSAGLRVFSTTRKQLKERGGQASFINMQPQIKEVFEIMKSLPGVAVFESVAELDRYLAARQRAHEEKGH
jgi:anti-sigma B factor antagonist